MPHVTLQQVARAAGVSVATASRALRQSPLIRASTAAKVRRAAAAVGYRLSPLVAAYMSYVRGAARPGLKVNLAVLSSGESAQSWREVPSWLGFYRGMQHRARELGYGLDHVWMRAPGLTPERLEQVLQARGIRGVVLLPFPDGYGRPELKWERLAVATVGYALSSPQLNWACSRHYQIIGLTLNELTRLGYRRIGLALPPRADRFADGTFLARYLLFQSSLPPAARVVPFCCRDFTEWSAPRLLRWYRRQRPDAIVTMNPQCRAWLQAAGVAVPGKVGLATLDLTATLTDWSGIDECSEAVGVAALDLVIEQLNRAEPGIPAHPKAVLIDGRWVAGRTTRVQEAVLPLAGRGGSIAAEGISR